MKIPFKRLALFFVLSMVAVSCQKETIIDPVAITGGEVSFREAIYTIDGVTGQMTFPDDASWNQFLERMFVLAEEGHSVSFRDGNSSQRNASKEVVTYTTKNKDEAIAWANAMVENGYTVYVQYDKDSGVYTCTAIK
jgi:hypothetical protein